MKPRFKTQIFLLKLSILFGVNGVQAQLPPVAQAIYDSAVVQDAAMVQYAIDNGAEISATPDGNSFFIRWFPNGQVPANSPVIVSLHGSNGYAFHEFYNWHAQALLHGCGIIALQWYRPMQTPPSDYFNDSIIYNYLDSILTQINYPSGKALLHGFSRGSARSYAVVFNDIQSGNNYFCTTLSNSGGADLNYPLYSEIDNGDYGASFFAGKHWTLFCGGQDPNPTLSGCIAMDSTKIWLESLGASIDLFIQDAQLGHDGFQLQSSFAYKDSVLNNYLSCFNGTLDLSAQDLEVDFHLSPNPCSDALEIRFPNHVATGSASIWNPTGELVKIIPEFSGSEIKISFQEMPAGIYLIRLELPDQNIHLKFLIEP